MMTYKDFTNYVKQYPDENGRFGEYGGAYLPPQLVPVFQQIDDAYERVLSSDVRYRFVIDVATL